MFMLPILIFFAVTFGLIGLFLWLAPSKTTQRLQAMSTAEEKSKWTENIVTIISPFAKLSLPTRNWETSPLRIKFLNAGIRYRDAHLIYFGLMTLLPLVTAALTFLVLGVTGQPQGLMFLLYLFLAAMVGCYLPKTFLYWKSKNRKREIFETFPDAVDLMLVCVEAGLGLDAGLIKVADEIKMKSLALAEELHLTNLEMRAGATRAQTLRNLALRTGVAEIATFATMLTQADKFGTSIGESLRVFSDDLRHKRQIRAEEIAAKVPTKMLFPLVLFIFPSIIMVIMGPAVIQIIRTILPMLNGSL